MLFGDIIRGSVAVCICVLVGTVIVGDSLSIAKSDICFGNVISVLLKTSDVGTVLSVSVILDSIKSESFSSKSPDSESSESSDSVSESEYCSSG